MKWVGVLSVVSMAALLSDSAVAQTATFTRLGDLDGGAFSSTVRAISADGSCIVGESTSALGTEAFRWTLAGGMVGLGDVAGGEFDSVATAVSADGSVVVGYGTADLNTVAFRWTESELMVPLELLSATFPRSEATGVSADGSVIVGFSNYGESGFKPCRWTTAGATMPVGSDDAGFGAAGGVSADGSVIVGGYYDPDRGGYEAFRWTQAGGIAYLGELAGEGGTMRSEATAVSADGAVVGGWSKSLSSMNEPFCWTQAESMVSLGHSGPGYVTGLSADGSTIVGWVPGAFIWDADEGWRWLQAVLIDDYGLDLTEWVLYEAGGISSDGLTIAGTGVNPSGDFEAWVVTLPAPATFAGDLNEDGFVGQGDLDIVLSQWGRTGPGILDPRADVNGDEFVGQYDLDQVLENWGHDTPPAGVPEPATLALVALGSLALIGRKRVLTQ